MCIRDSCTTAYFFLATLYTSSISAMIRDLEWPFLQQSRYHSRLFMMYKIRNTLVEMDVSAQLHIQSSSRGRTFHIQQLQCNCKAYSNSYIPRTIRDWNALDVDPLQFQSVDSFRHHFNSTQPVHHLRHHCWPAGNGYSVMPIWTSKYRNLKCSIVTIAHLL